MAEPFGIVAGAIGISSAFTASVDCFEYIQLGCHLGRDFQTDLLAISCARLRLTHWGESVNIYNDSSEQVHATFPEFGMHVTGTAASTRLTRITVSGDDAKEKIRYNVGSRGISV